MNLKYYKTSLFPSAERTKTRRVISFRHYLETVMEEYKPLVMGFRKTKNKDLKYALPVFTPSGVWKGGHGEKNLEYLNGLASFDVDGVEDVDQVKEMCMSLPYVIMCMKSCSGNGVWGLVKFATGAHASHYNALIREMGEQGLILDTTSKNINRLRFTSWDDNVLINKDAVPFDLHFSPTGVTYINGGKKEKTRPVITSVVKRKVTRYEQSVIETYNKKITCDTILEEFGWEPVRSSQTRKFYIRPGATDKKQSGNLVENGFFCHTESTDLVSGRLHRPFDIFLILKHGGNLHNAIQEAKTKRGSWRERQNV